MPQRTIRLADLPEFNRQKVEKVFTDAGKPIPEEIVIEIAEPPPPVKRTLGERVALELQKKRAEMDFRKENKNKIVVHGNVPFYRQRKR